MVLIETKSTATALAFYNTEVFLLYYSASDFIVSKLSMIWFGSALIFFPKIATSSFCGLKYLDSETIPLCIFHFLRQKLLSNEKKVQLLMFIILTS